jgi:hypothetical protein
MLSSEATVTLYSKFGKEATYKVSDCQKSVNAAKDKWDVFVLDGKDNKLKWTCTSGTKAPTDWAPPVIKATTIFPGALQTKEDGKCLDYNYGNNNVFMYDCHGGSNQDWYVTEDGALKTKYDDKCLDYDTGKNNVYMYDCHKGKNQQWYFKDGHLQSRHDGKCLDYNVGNKNVFMHDCHDGKNQQWFFVAPAVQVTAGSLKTMEDDKCLDYNTGNNNVIMYDCHIGKNQDWYIAIDGALKTKHDDKCLDYNAGNGNVYMHGCHGNKNQQWYFADGHLKTRHDGKCLDYNVGNKNVYMHDCHDGKNQQWYFKACGFVEKPNMQPTTVLRYTGSDHGCQTAHGQCFWSGNDAKANCMAWSECEALYCTARHNGATYGCYARKKGAWSSESGDTVGFEKSCKAEATSVLQANSSVVARSLQPKSSLAETHVHVAHQQFSAETNDHNAQQVDARVAKKLALTEPTQQSFFGKIWSWFSPAAAHTA